jgi:hypothetical protein
MNYKQILQHLGLTENIDFTLTESSFEMLPKTRQVSQIVEHEAVAEIPAVLDENGEEVSPTIPAVEAYSETVFVNEQYVPEAPSAEAIQIAHEELQLKAADLALLINEYLADKSELRDPENDEMNLSEGRIIRWGFVNIPKPTNSELLALIPQAESNANQASINAAAKKCLADTDWYVTRFAETGVAIPAEITAERAAARASIV